MTQRPEPDRERDAEIDHRSGGTEPSDAAALADELGRVQLQSIDDRHLRARIERVVERDAETIRLWYRLPHDVREFEDFEKPIPWSDRFKFVRVIEDLGYSPSSLAAIEGEEIVLERDDGWHAADPDDRRAGDYPHESIGSPPMAGLGFGITVLYLLLLFVATADTVNVAGALAVAVMLCVLALLVTVPW